jgi:hypothetical protein
VETQLQAAIAAHIDELRKPGVLSVRTGYKVVAGWPTRKPAIVVTVEHKTDAIPAADQLPQKLDGFAVDVREASPLNQLALTDPEAYAAMEPQLPAEQRVDPWDDEQLLRAAPAREAPPAARAPSKPRIPYTVPEGVELKAVEDQFTVICHTSPDAGWPTLSAFFDQIDGRLAVGLYDFTSKHVLDGLQSALAGKRLDLVLDHPAPNPTSDQSDEETHAALASELGDNLQFAWALEGADPFAAVAIFPNAYHIKVAVRDEEAFWLSSGNWNNSNQPAIDPIADPADRASAKKYDRDWHVIIEHPGLAQTFAAYLENDLSVASAHQIGAADRAAPEMLELLLQPREVPLGDFAQFFAPQTFTDRMRIQPLLTPDPDVYSAAVLALIQGATTSLYIQTQYLHPSGAAGDEAFSEILQAVVDRQKAGVDVRMIFSQWQTTKYLERMQAFGFDLTQVRTQQGVHNKGIVRDGATVLVSSENWSGDGVLRNRDAGVIIENLPIAQFFQQIFMHDWTQLARQVAVEA